MHVLRKDFGRVGCLGCLRRIGQIDREQSGRVEDFVAMEKDVFLVHTRISVTIQNVLRKPC